MKTGEASARLAKRIHDLAIARDLASSGHTAAARAIFASYGVTHVAVEINRTIPLVLP